MKKWTIARNRLTLVAACLVLAMAVGATNLGAAPAATYASPLHSLTQNDFRQVALQGFGDPQNSWAWAMEWYQNKLYVGTARDLFCTTWAALNYGDPSNPYPYPDPYLVYPCNPIPQLLPVAAQIWALTPTSTMPLTQADWTEVYSPPYTVPITLTGTMAPRDMAYRDMLAYTDVDGTQALYVSGLDTAPYNGPQVPPPSLLRTTDGITFTPVPADPGTTLGNINYLGQGTCCLHEQVSYRGKFYVVISTFQGGGTVYVSPDPRLGDSSFQPFTPSSMKVESLAVFNGHLYIGGPGKGVGYTVWRTDANCPTLPCPAADFTSVIPPGGGIGGSANGAVISMHVYTDTTNVPHLYVGTGNSTQPADLVRVNQDDTWDLIVGNPRVVNGVTITPTSGLTAGFGWQYNEHMWRMEDYNGVLYVGTFDSSTLLEDAAPGLDLGPNVGFDLWASADGLTFTPVTQNGFGNEYNFGGRSLKATPYGLFLGTANWDQGLQLWQGSVPTNSIELAPKNLQIDLADGPGAVALAWDAAPSDVLFHVYRATAARKALPALAKPITIPDVESPGSTTSVSLPRSIWVPGDYSEIGTTTAPYFVDHSAPPGAPTSYYVVAQDAAGNLSAPSNAVDVATAPGATFHSISALLTSLVAQGHLNAVKAQRVRTALWLAYARLWAGDAPGSHKLLEIARRQVLSSARGSIAQLYAGKLALWLGRLEKRITLVNAHILAPSFLAATP